MPGNIYDWSTTAGSNATADPDINWSEGMFPSSVNDSARQMMARVAQWLDDNGVLDSLGTNTIAVTTNSPIVAITTGMTLSFRAANTNTGPVTLNVNGLGGKDIRKVVAGGTDSVALDAGDINISGVYIVHYDSATNAGAGAWILINNANSASAAIASAPTKSPPVDGDGFAISDSASSGSLKRVLWSVIKSFFVLKAGDTMTGNLATSGKFTSAQAFDSAGTLAILAATGAGTVSLRPNGVASATGQAVVSTNGDLAASGKMTASTVFESSTGNAFLASAGTGGVVALRPNGGTNIAGQAVLSSAGIFTAASDVNAGAAALQANTGVTFGSSYVGGNVLTHIDSRMNNAINSIMPTVAAQGVGAVGTTALMATAATVPPGTLFNGVSLFFADAAGNIGASPGSGTSWRSMGYSSGTGGAGNVTAWKREA